MRTRIYHYWQCWRETVVEPNWKHSSHMRPRWNFNLITALSRNRTQVITAKYNKMFRTVRRITQHQKKNLVSSSSNHTAMVLAALFWTIRTLLFTATCSIIFALQRMKFERLMNNSLQTKVEELLLTESATKKLLTMLGRGQWLSV